MRLLDRYIARAILRGFTLTLVVLTLLISLGALVKELDDVGDGVYSIQDALLVTALTIPERMLELVAVSALVGGIVGLGALAASSELLVAQTLGASPARIARTALLTSLPIILATAAVSEYLMPPLSQQAARRKRIATRGPEAAITDQAIWFKDANRMVRIGGVTDTHLLTDVTIYTFDPHDRLLNVTTAATATIEDRDRWMLLDVTHDTPTTPVRTMANDDIASPLSTSTLDLLVSPTELLPLSRLWHDTRPDGPASDNDTMHRHLWRRLMRPLLAAAMLLLAVPFALGQTAAAKLGWRLTLGAVTGVLAHIGVEAVAYLGALARLDPIVVAAAPLVLTTTLSIVLVARTN